jgi:hypothetical protein
MIATTTATMTNSSVLSRSEHACMHAWNVFPVAKAEKMNNLTLGLVKEQYLFSGLPSPSFVVIESGVHVVNPLVFPYAMVVHDRK